MKNLLLLCFLGAQLVPLVANAQIGITAHGTTRKFVSSKGGEGSSFNKPIYIHAADWSSGVQSEFAYAKAHFPGAKVLTRNRQYTADKTFDILTLQMPSGEKRLLYFDYRLQH